MLYASPPGQGDTGVSPYRPLNPPVRGYPGRPGGLHQGRNQNGHPPFYGYYSGYLYYLSPYQHPLVMQQASTAASNWFLDAVGKMPWNQIIPSWAEMARMGMRSVQDQLPANLARWRARHPREEPLRNATGQMVHGLVRWA
jgi:hypothetical protein